MTIYKADKFISENKHLIIEDYRLVFHGMPEFGWMNDPNGLVFYEDNYHIFYQHYPYDSVWGPMHWGHLVSKDMIKFEYMPIALAPDKDDETGCFSGGAIVDSKNKKLLHLFYTKHYEKDGIKLETQGLASSLDGINFIKYDKPIIDEKLQKPHTFCGDVRDPSPVFINGKYYIILGTKSKDNKGKFAIYSSPDLSSFEYHDEIIVEGLFGNMGECPDLSEVGNKEVFLYSQIKYDAKLKKNRNTSHVIIGDIDIENKTYHIDQNDFVDKGHHFYAPQTLVDNKGRVIMIAWMEMWGEKQVTHELGHNWMGATTFPRVLSVEDNHLYQWPIKELENYYMNSKKIIQKQVIKKQTDIYITKTSSDYTLKVKSTTNENDYFEIGYHNNQFYIDGSKLLINKLCKIESNITYNEIELRILLDTSSIEIFINNGFEVFTSRIYIDSNNYILESSTMIEGVINTIEV